MPVCRRFRELIDSIYFAFKTRRDAACKWGNFREFVSYMHLARFASSVSHTSFQMSLFFSWFPILSQFNFFLWITPTYYKTVFVFFVVRSLCSPIWSNFRCLGLFGFPRHITPDVILHNLIKFPITCLVSRWPLLDGRAHVADRVLIFRGISFRYWWEPAKQDNISRVCLHLSTKLSQNTSKW